MSAVSADYFSTANAHALDSIVKATETRTIVAADDIYDENGQKLWARNQPVSSSLQQRLLQRKLRKPLESCLRVEDGVTGFTLVAEIEAMLASDHALAGPLRPYGPTLISQARQLPVHAVATLLLTAVHQAKPEVFRHAVWGMVLAGGIAISTALPSYDVKLAMLGGLLHDIGEMYINPEYLDKSSALDVKAFKHVLVHPRIGSLVISQLTDYPKALAQAIDEHHERVDGSGYPARLRDLNISPLGRMLAVVEATLGVVSHAEAPLSRASLALRVVPGEFDPRYVAFIANAARSSGESVGTAVRAKGNELVERGESLRSRLQQALLHAIALKNENTGSPGFRTTLDHVHTLLQSVTRGWNATGLWDVQNGELDVLNRFDAEISQRELGYRLRAIARECQMVGATLPVQDSARLQSLCTHLNENPTS